MEDKRLFQRGVKRRGKRGTEFGVMEGLTLAVGLVGLPTLPGIGLEGSACSDK